MGLVEMGVELFGRHDFSLAGLSVEDGVVQGFAFVKDGDLTLRALGDGDLSFTQGITGALGVDLVDDLVVLEGEVLGNSSGLLEGEDQVKFFLGERQGAVSMMSTAGLDSKARIEIGYELW